MEANGALVCNLLTWHIISHGVLAVYRIVLLWVCGCTLVYADTPSVEVRVYGVVGDRSVSLVARDGLSPLRWTKLESTDWALLDTEPARPATIDVSKQKVVIHFL